MTQSNESTTYREWRLQGVARDRFPSYDEVARDEDRVVTLKNMFHKIQRGEYDWRWATLTSREVTIHVGEWEIYEPCEYTFAHTRNWCGNRWCRES